jgi:dTDP-4-amino-4,6-dideoxygalactose transaminase
MGIDGRIIEVPFSRPMVSISAREAVATALEKGAFAGQGAYSSVAEQKLSAMHDNKLVVLTNSGTTALIVALLSYQLEPGDRVLVPSFGFIALAQAVILAGGTPVFVDVNRSTGSISADSLDGCDFEGIRGLIVIHYGGFAADMDRIEKTASAKGWFIVEDAAHGLDGAHARGKLGTLGAIGILSFDHQKNVQCGEGGALILNDMDHLERVRSIVRLGTNSHDLANKPFPTYDWVSSGLKGYPPDYVAALLEAQLEKTAQIQSGRAAQYENYLEGLALWAEARTVLIPVAPTFAVRPSWHIFWLTFQRHDLADSFINWMQQAGIECKKHYSSLAGLTNGKAYESMPTTASDHLASCLVRLPLGPHLTPKKLNHVVSNAVAWKGVMT